MTTALATLSFDEMTRLAESVARSGLFGMKTADQALALMAISAAEGTHPALAARDYHIIQGRPTLKSDAMLARFQSAGGRMKMTEYTDARVVAEFSHPQGGTIVVDWDIERAKRAGLGGKDTWKQYPRQMLRARVISEGVRAVFPGATAGLMAPEEAADLSETPAEKDVTPAKPLTGVAALQARIAEVGKVDTDTGEITSQADADPVIAAIAAADSEAALDATADLAAHLEGEQKVAARKAYAARRKELRGKHIAKAAPVTYPEVRHALERATNRDAYDLARSLIAATPTQFHAELHELAEAQSTKFAV